MTVGRSGESALPQARWIPIPRPPRTVSHTTRCVLDGRGPVDMDPATHDTAIADDVACVGGRPAKRSPRGLRSARMTLGVCT